MVDNANEFVEAIGSNRIIQLRGSPIHLSSVPPEKRGTNFRYSKEFDGNELVIFGVQNLKIIGMGATPVKVITKPVYGDVIVFENCTNITIENVDAGHSPEKGQCTGGVFNFIKSKNITINNSIMYGSGMEGITAENVTKLICNNSKIRGCSYSIMTLSKCNNFEFNNCEFTDNQEFDLVNITNSTSIKFNSCLFANNKTNIDEYSTYSLFNISESKLVQLKGCTIQNNSSIYFSNDANGIDVTDTEIENNYFSKGNYKQ
jgi:hypothetical protein